MVAVCTRVIVWVVLHTAPVPEATDWPKITRAVKVNVSDSNN